MKHSLLLHLKGSTHAEAALWEHRKIELLSQRTITSFILHFSPLALADYPGKLKVLRYFICVMHINSLDIPDNHISYSEILTTL